MHDVQICSRDYSGVRGAVWDYSDSQQDEEDFSTLAGAVKINRFMVMVMVITMMMMMMMIMTAPPQVPGQLRHLQEGRAGDQLQVAAETRGR